jgi:hypothetical protein
LIKGKELPRNSGESNPKDRSSPSVIFSDGTVYKSGLSEYCDRAWHGFPVHELSQPIECSIPAFLGVQANGNVLYLQETTSSVPLGMPTFLSFEDGQYRVSHLHRNGK